ncbi:branched-chain amino acid ABC transporter permease [Desulfatiglans anilini]|uniref:branched-chain amino acid ABC transporter permease n=1 Tax=Desulfatiglans anilini TaxID=90728 RepID=UPI00042054F6|nr:branched-chain amino acid ABC transporter permease [Desulfatiglans anilini]
MKRTAGIQPFWLLAVIAVGVLPFSGLGTYTLQILTLAGINAAVAIGLNLVLGTAGQISLGQAAFVGIGAYTTARLMTGPGISFWLAMPAGGALAGLIGAALGYLALRFQGHYLAMITLCFGLIMHIFFLEFPFLTGGAGGIANIPYAGILGHAIDNGRDALFKTFHLSWFLVLLVYWLLNNLTNLGSGRALAALRDDPIAAESVGVPTAVYKVQAFTVSAVAAGLAGGVYAVHTHYVGPEIFGVGASLEFLIIVVIGGLGSPVGAILGALLMAVLPELMRSYEEYRLLFFGMILMVIVVAAPGGLWGGVSTGVVRICSALRRRFGTGGA